ncbi:hypothetical protein [Oceanobacter kriegii]|uniref:hypothetical protein n=1 Tax=Oceanobacter kriegii TaxID=64972 RepID=UPI000409CC7E|nr:hypothetical protein [Oceanobacter kriegii]
MNPHHILLSALLLAASQSGNTAERDDYDLDNDGLIEINDLADLDQIRHEYDDSSGWQMLYGQTLYGVSDGCPEAGCHGYELANDLNFDTNLNGEFDADDAYWNEGLGFAPIGDGFAMKLAAEFNGNGHRILNLTINRPGESFTGLFSYAEEANLHDLILHASIQGGDNSGALLGYGWRTQVSNIQAQVTMDGDDSRYLGGLLGFMDDSPAISNLIVDADIRNGTYTGAVAGGMGTASAITAVAVRTTAQNVTQAGGVVGYSNNSQLQWAYAEVDMTAAPAWVDGNIGGTLGGLIGNSSYDSIRDVLLTGTVAAAPAVDHYARIGGVLGQDSDPVLNYGTQLERVISLVRVNDEHSNNFTGALVGEGIYLNLSEAYWPSDFSNRYAIGNELAGYREVASTASLADIQCADNQQDGCNGLVFTGFATSGASGYWNFGSDSEAPVMTVAGHDMGDSDGDGITDVWPGLDLSWPEPEPEPEPGSESGGSSGGSGWLLLPLLLPISLLGMRGRRRRADSAA